MLLISSFRRLRKRLIVMKSGFGGACKPYEVDVTAKKPLYLTTGVNVVHIGIMNDLKHHLGMIRRTTLFPIKFFHMGKIEMLYYMIQNTHRIIFCNIFVYSLRKKNHLVLYVRNIM